MTVHFSHFGGYESVVEAIPLYGKREFASPTRSTIPLMSLLIHDPATFREIVRRLGMPECHELCLEHQVRSPRGKGKASHTDVMLRWEADALAIEAKWTEPMGKTVAEWRGKKEGDTNRAKVLEGWLDLLRHRLQTPLDAADFEFVLYQMLHRAASAAHVGKSPRLAYLRFHPSPDPSTPHPDQVFEQLGILWHKLGQPATFPFSLVEVALRPTPAYEALRPLPKGEPATAQAITAALRDTSTSLFDFEILQIRQVLSKS